MSRPETIDAIVMATALGTVSRPDVVELAPRTTCRNSGTYALTAYMPMPMTKPPTHASRTTLSVNSHSGMIGSATRCSTRTKMMVNMSDTRIKPSVVVDPQP